MALYAVGFGLATAAVALALVLDLWLALLIVFGVLLLCSPSSSGSSPRR